MDDCADHSHARSKAWTVFPRSNTGVVGSNPIQGMDVFVGLFCVYVVLCVGSGLMKGSSPSKESYRLCIGLRNWKSDQDPIKGCRAIGEWWMMKNWKGFGRKRPLSSRGTIPEFSWRCWGKWRKFSIRIDGVPTRSRSQTHPEYKSR
jgi:hypothetical protein